MPVPAGFRFQPVDARRGGRPAGRARPRRAGRPGRPTSPAREIYPMAELVRGLPAGGRQAPADAAGADARPGGPGVPGRRATSSPDARRRHAHLGGVPGRALRPEAAEPGRVACRHGVARPPRRAAGGRRAGPAPHGHAVHGRARRGRPDAGRRDPARQPLPAGGRAGTAAGGADPHPVRPGRVQRPAVRARRWPGAASRSSCSRPAGTFGSGGQFRPFTTEQDDGLATVGWLRKQPGATGGSR